MSFFHSVVEYLIHTEHNALLSLTFDTVHSVSRCTGGVHEDVVTGG